MGSTPAQFTKGNREIGFLFCLLYTNLHKTVISTIKLMQTKTKESHFCNSLVFCVGVAGFETIPVLKVYYYQHFTFRHLNISILIVIYFERIIMRLTYQLKHPLQPRRLNNKLSNYRRFATTKIAMISVILYISN